MLMDAGAGPSGLEGHGPMWDPGTGIWDHQVELAWGNSGPYMRPSRPKVKEYLNPCDFPRVGGAYRLGQPSGHHKG